MLIGFVLTLAWQKVQANADAGGKWGGVCVEWGRGGGLSMILYVLSLEPLLESIRLDNNITGIKIPGKSTQNLLAFADDTNFFP